MHISYSRWKVQWERTCWMWASFCWVGRAPTEPFNEMTVCYMYQTGAHKCVWVCMCVSCVCVCVCVCGWGLSVSVPVCLTVMSIYFSVYSLQVCLSSANRHLLQQTRVTRDGNTVEIKHHIQYMYFTVTNHSDGSHHWEILWYTVCYTGIYIYI